MFTGCSRHTSHRLLLLLLRLLPTHRVTCTFFHLSRLLATVVCFYFSFFEKNFFFQLITLSNNTGKI